MSIPPNSNSPSKLFDSPCTASFTLETKHHDYSMPLPILIGLGVSKSYEELSMPCEVASSFLRGIHSDMFSELSIRNLVIRNKEIKIIDDSLQPVCLAASKVETFMKNPEFFKQKVNLKK